ncbi:MAG: hypothetical protein AAF629_19460 [Chloroflexota bacterium]
MKKSLIPFILSLVLIGFHRPLALDAQSACPFAVIQLETQMSVDQNALCQAAQPWAEDGVRIFILLTDFQPENEVAWFDYLDQVEATAGLRDTNQADSFARDALAFEFSTATSLAWGQSITYGEALTGSDLDDDEAVIRDIKNDIRLSIASGDATGGFVSGLETTYLVVNPPPSPFRWVIWGTLGVGGVGIAGYAVSRAMRPQRERKKRQAALAAHLETLRSRTNNVLSASDRLLDGDGAQATVLYQLFSAYGGESDPEMDEQIQDWLTLSQSALQDAFDLRRQLDDPQTQQRPLEAQVEDWEMLYVTLVGSSDRILNLTDDELRTLLDPMLTLEREEASDQQLSNQLDQIRRELSGLPLKIDLQMVEAASTDTEGILGYLDQVQGQIAYHRQISRQAPSELQTALAERKRLGEELPTPFIVKPKILFDRVDKQIKVAETSLTDNQPLAAWNRIEVISAGLDAIEQMVTSVALYNETLPKITAITDAGYQPPTLLGIQSEIETDISMIQNQIGIGDYQGALPFVEEFQADFEQALIAAETWQKLEQQNEVELADLHTQGTQLQQYHTDEAATSWQSLQNYDETNWDDLSGTYQDAAQALKDLESHLPEIEHLNQMDVQRFDEAERLLTLSQEALITVDETLRGIVNRLAEVQTAEKHWPQTLKVANADAQKAEAYRNEHNRKISPEIDEQLQNARTLLTDGEAQAKQHRFVDAMSAMAEARALISQANLSANEQVQKINAAQAELKTIARQTNDQVIALKDRIAKVGAGAKSEQTSGLVQQTYDSLSEAKRSQMQATDLEDLDWLQALNQTIEDYRRTSSQAGQAVRSIKADQQTWEKLQAETQQAVNQARMVIQRVETTVNHPHAGNVGRKTLQQAKSTLPDVYPEPTSPKQAQRVLASAKDAIRYAEQAETLAQKQINFVRDRQQAREFATWTSTVAQGPLTQPFNMPVSPNTMPAWGKPRPRPSGNPRPRPRPSPRSSSMGRSTRR